MRTLEARQRQIDEHFGQRTPVKSLNERIVNAFRRARRGQGDTPFTINTKVGILEAAINQAVKAGWIARNPLEGMQNLSDARPPVWRFLREEEVDKLLAVLSEGTVATVKRKNGRNYRIKTGKIPILYRLVFFLLNTGARVGEALAAHWQNVDLIEGI